jgi:cell division protein FtsQ
VRFSSGRGRVQGAKSSTFVHNLAHWGLWGLALCTGIAVICLLFYGLREYLFVRNPHFTLRSVEVEVFGDLPPQTVVKRLSELGIAEGKVNLFAIDMGQLRREMSRIVVVNRVTLRRRLPGGLRVTVYERRPLAQLLAPRGHLIDEELLVLPERNDPKTWVLPIITGVRDAGKYDVGQVVDDSMVSAALKLLEIAGSESYGAYLDINLIQLDYPSRSLKVFLRHRQPFREGACVILPAKELEMREALRRVDAIVQERLRGRQVTGFIDATYKVNIPTRP